MSIAAAWQQCLASFATPLAIEPSTANSPATLGCQLQRALTGAEAEVRCQPVYHLVQQSHHLQRLNAGNAPRCWGKLLHQRIVLRGEQPPGSLRLREVVWRVLSQTLPGYLCNGYNQVEKPQRSDDGKRQQGVSRRQLLLLQTLRTRDFDELAGAFPRWNLPFRQFGRGPFRAHFRFLQLGGI
jgi:hypothetical protein